MAYQINWITAHLSTHNSFLSLVAPVWEHDFIVFKFLEDEHNDNDDAELSRIFSKSNGEWIVVKYRGYTCEFCDLKSCDRAQYGGDVDVFYGRSGADGSTSRSFKLHYLSSVYPYEVWFTWQWSSKGG